MNIKQPKDLFLKQLKELRLLRQESKNKDCENKVFNVCNNYLHDLLSDVRHLLKEDLENSEEYRRVEKDFETDDRFNYQFYNRV